MLYFGFVVPSGTRRSKKGQSDADRGDQKHLCKMTMLLTNLLPCANCPGQKVDEVGVSLASRTKASRFCSASVEVEEGVSSFSYLGD